MVDDDGDEFSDSTDVDVESFTPTYQPANPTQHFDDDPCVYANLSEISRRKMIEEIDRRSVCSKIKQFRRLRMNNNLIINQYVYVTDNNTVIW